MGRRITQHKPPRETEAKERADLKRENKALKKQTVRLRRQLQRVMETYQAAEQSTPEDVMATKTELTSAETCEKCSSVDIAKVEIPGGTLIACKTCKARRVSKNE